MRRSFKIASRIGAAVSVLMLCVFMASGGVKSQEKKARDKSRYYYLKGAESEAQEQFDRAYEYYRKAFKANPDNADASFAYGNARMNMLGPYADREDIIENLGYMRRMLDRYPGDVNSAETYAYYAGMADTFPEAIRVYNILVKEHPGLSRLYYPLAYYHMNLGQVDSAVMAISEYERLEGATDETTLRKVTYRLSVADTVGALADAKEYIKRSPGQPQPIIAAAMIYNILGQKDSAIMMLDEALAEFPENGELKFDIGVMSAEQGDTARFHTLVEEAFKNKGTDYEERIDILRIYTKNLPMRGSESQYKESDKLFEYAESLYPDDIDILEVYSEYELWKGNYKETFQKQKRAYSLDKANETSMRRVLSFSVLADCAEEGMKAFEEFPDLSVRRKGEIVMDYIIAAQSAKKFDTALEWTDTILSLTTPALTLEDSITIENADSIRAIYDLSSLITSSSVYEVAGDIYAKKGDKKGAVRSYENAINLAPDGNPSALNNYAYYLIETIGVVPGSEQFEKAKEMSRKSLEETEEYPQSTYYDTYAWILFKEKNYKDALKYQEMAMEMGPTDEWELLSHYGDILFMNEMPEEALKQWEKALKLDPENTLLKKKVENKTYFYE